MRARLSYQNVVATIAAVLLLAGGTAYAANQLAKNSVGTKQLKKNSVTAKKIKKNAVTAAKIKKNAVTSAKIADGSIKAADIDLGSTNFTRLVSRLHTDTDKAFEVGSPLYPIGTVTQNAGEDQFYYGSIDLTLPASCAAPRTVLAYLLLDADPIAPEDEEVIGFLELEDDVGGQQTRREGFTVYPGALFNPPTRGAPATTISHSLIAYLGGVTCASGGGVTATGATVDVIGAK
jgi:hypothetical protein